MENYLAVILIAIALVLSIVGTIILIPDTECPECDVCKICETSECEEFYPKWEQAKEFSEKQKALREDYIRQWKLNKERQAKYACSINRVYCDE